MWWHCWKRPQIIQFRNVAKSAFDNPSKIWQRCAMPVETLWNRRLAKCPLQPICTASYMAGDNLYSYMAATNSIVVQSLELHGWRQALMYTIHYLLHRGLNKMNLAICLRCSQGNTLHVCGEDSIQTHYCQRRPQYQHTTMFASSCLNRTCAAKHWLEHNACIRSRCQR